MINRWTRKERKILLLNYESKGPEFVSKLTGRTYNGVVIKAKKMGLKSPYNQNQNIKPIITSALNAQIIEDFICLQMTCKDLSVKYSLCYTTISRIVNKYFKYMGRNKEVLILKSKV